MSIAYTYWRIQFDCIFTTIEIVECLNILKWISFTVCYVTKKLQENTLYGQTYNIWLEYRNALLLAALNLLKNHHMAIISSYNLCQISKIDKRTFWSKLNELTDLPLFKESFAGLKLILQFFIQKTCPISVEFKDIWRH